MSEPADKTAASSSVGERLKAARIVQALTLQKIGEDLHLDLWVLEAMEENRFRALGAPVYARGHLRKYARLLGLDVDAVLAQYESTHAGPVAPTLAPTSVEQHPALVPEHRPRRSRTAVIVVVVALALAACAAAFWWWYTDPEREPASHAAAPALPVTAQKASASIVEDTVTPVAAQRNDRVDVKVSESKAVDSGAAPVAASGDGSAGRLGLRFLADCWVEVYDATGTRLLFDHRIADTARTLSGVPPFKVLLGNYAGVELTLDGRTVVIPERARYGATARFRILAGGKTLAAWGS